MLPKIDKEFLDQRIGSDNYNIASEENMICITLYNYSLPKGLNTERADLLLRLQPGYPDIAPDMWWFSPAVLALDRHSFPQTEAIEIHLGKAWQRWSRHLNGTQWRAGIDGLENYLALIRVTIEKAVRGDF